MSTVISQSPSTAPARRIRRPAAETRQHILDTAEDLFYWHGIHATGIDTIVAEAGIAPTTLYRLFGSKDDLVAAYVDRYADNYKEWINSITSAAGLSPQDRILALFDALMANTGADTFRGCPFLMTLAEYPDPSSTAHASAQAVKAWVRAKLHELTRQLPDRNRATADTLADQLALIIEGLYASTAALGTNGPARHAHALAALVIAATADRDPAGRGSKMRSDHSQPGGRHG